MLHPVISAVELTTDRCNRLSSMPPARGTVAAVLLALLVVLAGCSALEHDGSGDGMPFMDHSTAVAATPVGGSSNGTVDGDSNASLQASILLTVTNQTSNGQQVSIQQLEVPDGGYVAIHDARRIDAGLSRNIIGVSGYLDAGTHEDLTVTLFDVPGYNYSETAHLMGDGDVRVFVTVHRDTNANTTFDYVTSGAAADAPYRTDSGAIAADFATLTIDHGES